MQMVKKIIIGIIVIWFAILAFMPKTELYYKLEEELNKNSIQLNEDSIKEGIFTLSLNGVTVFGEGIEVAKIKNIKFFTLLGYTTIQINGLTFDDLLKGQAPKEVREVNIIHSIVNPMLVMLDANGSMGEVDGNINFSKNKLRVDFKDTKKLKALKKILKKDAKGWFYETNF